MSAHFLSVNKENSEETAALLLLHRRLRAHSRRMEVLIAHFGSAREIIGHDDPEAITGPGLRRLDAREIFKAPSASESRRIDLDLAWLDAPDHSIVVNGTVGYPPLLAETPAPPYLLFADGKPDLLCRGQLAIVGSRRTTASGRRTAERMAGELARAGLAITSGLALGVDAAAHRGALGAGGDTIAVLGCGCDIDYPPSNARLAARIREQGLVVSELPLGTRAAPWAFPLRNRIVTGLALGTLVVEAALRSGSLISARLAGEQGRDVFAVPGAINSAQSRGCHQLIKEGAKLAECVDDILEEITGLTTGAPEPVVPSALAALTARQKQLFELVGSEPVSVETLAVQHGFDVGEVLSLLVQLEISGIIVSDRAGYVRAEPYT